MQHKVRHVRHIHLDIAGAMRRPKGWVNCITYKGRLLTTPREVKDFFKYQLMLGRRVLPLSDECEGFDYQTGCPGHAIQEDDHAVD